MRATSLALAALLASSALPAHAKFSCSAARCADLGLVATTRAAVRDACPCEAATSRKAYAKCWKPVVKAAGVAKTCRQDVTRALVESTCGRPGFVLCRGTTKKGSEICRVKKNAKCDDVFDTGVFSSCADTCDEIIADPFPTTKELGSGDLGSLEPDPGDGTLHFTTAPASLADVAVGNILVAGVAPGTPRGLLRAVLAVERDGDSLTLRTGQAPIQLAYRRLHVRFVRSLSVPAPSAAQATRTRRSHAVAAPLGIDVSQPFDFLLFDGDSNPSTLNDQVSISGTVGGGFDFDLALDVDWGDIVALPDVVTNCLESFADVLTGGLPDCSIDDLLPEAKASFLVYPRVAADANVRGAAILEFKKELELASEPLPPIVIGPLVFVPVADVTARLSGGASAAFSTGLHGSAVFETSVVVSSKQTGTPQFKPPALKDSDLGPNDTSVTLHAEAKVGVGTRLNVLLYGVTGPYAEARAYGAIEADALDDPCWMLHAGIEGELGIEVTSPALPLIGKVVLVDWHTPTLNPVDVALANGQCEEPPGSSTLPPGSGPDADHLANPTYTPWARSFTSPVEGALAGSPGNGTVFSELERTIDGRYVRSGYGVDVLTKFDEDGTLVWARSLDFEGAPLLPLRLRSAGDGTMVAVSRTITAPILLTTLAQDGSVVDARAYDVPLEVCNVDVTALASDGGDGWYVTGSCVGAGSSFLLHAQGGTATFRLLEIPSSRLNVVEQIGGDAFLAGRMNDGLDALVALRMRPDGSLAYAKRYAGCVSAPDAIPSKAVVGPLGEVTIAGSGGAQHNGLVLRLLPDGSVGFASFPGFGFGAGSVFLLDSIAELPTTGYVAGGSLVKLTGSVPESTPSAALVGLDAAGHILWANRYTYGGPGTYAATGHTAVRLADDGGVVTTALVTDPGDPLGGRLWAFKPFAKDGSIPLQSDAATILPLDVTDLACSMTASDLTVGVGERAIGTRTVVATSAPAALTVAQQTAQ
jgi:hypothetical protein